jgi:hypothetical protein
MLSAFPCERSTQADGANPGRTRRRAWRFSHGSRKSPPHPSEKPLDTRLSRKRKRRTQYRFARRVSRKGVGVRLPAACDRGRLRFRLGCEPAAPPVSWWRARVGGA